ncbi:uncharacterized protein LOC127791157 isoform X3 [Diospyros lotus]|uniref:uncharacterized protein LOC127791157 isoform X3 n=1 Tax=Diospyros lotus TaxID=55363 RepID=UPI00225C0599|nr:uncharacterized protein LOC127791157 isoform X3 [Diospyros lotus]
MDSSSAGGSSGKSGNSNSRERERYFDAKAKARCWANAETVPGRHPERWRKDAAGNVVCKRFSNCLGCLCFEYDHIIPYSKGGESVAENCQILQTRVNRFKSDKDKVDATQLRGYSCDIKFTGGRSMYTSSDNLPCRKIVQIHLPQICDNHNREFEVPDGTPPKVHTQRKNTLFLHEPHPL